eukprot:TRINITY_DN3476_c1_g1_i1.p1 TRINITY_DN3476_c1_g1~~TRINITY_DN3476_c1_g1_i1.p1  ORF type:complete len:736 (+),score=206.66 TRINITY_DN3476_c1_g1_i1:117-2324(+)
MALASPEPERIPVAQRLRSLGLVSLSDAEPQFEGDEPGGECETVFRGGGYGMGGSFVYRGWYPGKPGRVLAIKRLPVNRSQRRSEVTPSERELLCLRDMRGCENSLQMVEAVLTSHSDLWIVSEWCGGGSVAAVMRHRQAGLKEAEVAAVVSGAAAGLVHLHRSGWLHRDLRAENLLLHAAPARCVVSDFGNAAQPVEGKTPLGQPGAAHWQAPEVASAQPYGLPSDVWSLGVTCIELSENATPGQRQGMPADFAAIWKSSPTLSDASEWSPQLVDFVARCLRVAPSERIETAEIPAHDFIRTVPVAGSSHLEEMVEEQVRAGKARREEELRQPPPRFGSDSQSLHDFDAESSLCDSSSLLGRSCGPESSPQVDGEPPRHRGSSSRLRRTVDPHRAGHSAAAPAHQQQQQPPPPPRQSSGDGVSPTWRSTAAASPTTPLESASARRSPGTATRSRPGRPIVDQPLTPIGSNTPPIPPPIVIPPPPVLIEPPTCVNGDPMRVSDYQGAQYSRGWLCRVCRRKKKGERWFCMHCDDDVCFDCERPRNNVDALRKDNLRLVEIVQDLMGRLTVTPRPGSGRRQSREHAPAAAQPGADADGCGDSSGRLQAATDNLRAALQEEADQWAAGAPMSHRDVVARLQAERDLRRAEAAGLRDNLEATRHRFRGLLDRCKTLLGTPGQLATGDGTCSPHPGSKVGALRSERIRNASYTPTQTSAHAIRRSRTHAPTATPDEGEA